MGSELSCTYPNAWNRLGESKSRKSADFIEGDVVRANIDRPNDKVKETLGKRYLLRVLIGSVSLASTSGSR